MSDDKAEATYHGPVQGWEYARSPSVKRIGDAPLGWQPDPVNPGWEMPVPFRVKPASGAATWALVLGIVGVLAGWCMFGLPSIAAIILGHIGERQTKDDRTTGRGMAVTGLVLGYVMLLPAVVLTFWMLLGGAASVVSPQPVPSATWSYPSAG